jgi:hypothetical protein
MLNLMMAAALEDMQKTPDIGINIGVRVIERIADAGLRREMDDAVRLLFGEHRLYHLALGEVRLDEMESVATLEPRQPRLLERHIIVGAEIVEPDYFVAAIEQPGRRVETDEAGGAGY